MMSTMNDTTNRQPQKQETNTMNDTTNRPAQKQETNTVTSSTNRQPQKQVSNTMTPSTNRPPQNASAAATAVATATTTQRKRTPFALPTEKTVPRTGELPRVKMLVYGEPKIGKSTFASRMPDVLFVDTDGGLDYLSTYRCEVFSWETFLSIIESLLNEKNRFKTIVIDTVDKLYEYCENFACREEGIKYMSKSKFGGSYCVAKTEFNRAISRLFSTGLGVVFTSHAKQEVVSNKSGEAHEKYVPTVPAKIAEIVSSLVDIVTFAHVERRIGAQGELIEERVMEFGKSNAWVAGDRTGRFPETLPFKWAVFEKYLKNGNVKATSHPIAEQSPTNEASNEVPLTDFDTHSETHSDADNGNDA